MLFAQEAASGGQASYRHGRRFSRKCVRRSGPWGPGTAPATIAARLAAIAAHVPFFDLCRYSLGVSPSRLRKNVVLAESLVEQIPDPLLARLLLYALHADSDLDVEEIYRNLSGNPQLEQRAMSVAEKLRAQGLKQGLEQGLEQGLQRGRAEGRAAGLWIGKIMALEEFLGLRQTSWEDLELLPLDELEARHGRLHRDYEARFKGG